MSANAPFGPHLSALSPSVAILRVAVVFLIILWNRLSLTCTNESLMVVVLLRGAPAAAGLHGKGGIPP